MNSLLIQVTAVIERIFDKLHITPSIRWPFVQKARQLLNIHRETNLSAALAFFQAHPSESVDVEHLTHEVHRAQHILDDLQHTDQISSKLQLDIPKTIWMYWHSGLENAPEVVKIAYKSWREMNPDYEVRFLDDRQLKTLIDLEQLFKIASIEITIAHKSDFLRTYLLCRYGGVWADSTTFCWQPLTNWLPSETASTGFFIFRQPNDRKDRQITNWFIASSRRNPITCSQFSALINYIFKPRDIMLKMRKPRHYYHMSNISRMGTGYLLLDEMEKKNTYPYFFYHYLFNEAVKDGDNSKLWRGTLAAKNYHAKNHGNIDKAYVSKQTHKGDYVQSETFKNRKKWLLRLLSETDKA